jgi:hypothetical protein
MSKLDLDDAVGQIVRRYPYRATQYRKGTQGFMPADVDPEDPAYAAQVDREWADPDPD